MMRVRKTLRKEVLVFNHTFRCFSSTSKTIKPSYVNIDPSLHSKEEQTEYFEPYAKESVAKRNVILHAIPKGNFQYGYAATFTGKVESYLKYNKIDHRVNETDAFFPQPMNKVPWITYDGIHTADSQLIIQRLNEAFNIDNDAQLTAEQRQISFAFRVAMDRFYFVDIYRRYVSDENIQIYFDTIFPERPQYAQELVPVFQPMACDHLWKQGIRRFDGDTVYKMHVEYIDNVLDYLGNKPFFFGDEISSVDFSIYAQLGSAYSLDFKFPNTTESDGTLHRVDEVLAYICTMETAIA
eukprot:184990_1